MLEREEQSSRVCLRNIDKEPCSGRCENAYSVRRNRLWRLRRDLEQMAKERHVTCTKRPKAVVVIRDGRS